MNYLERRLKIKRLFDKNAQLPKTEEEFNEWFTALACELSPEFLTCDGEATQAQIKAKKREILESWAELEALYGKKVDINNFGV